MRIIFILITLLISFNIYAKNSADDARQFMSEYIQSYNVYLATGETADINKVTNHFFEPTLQVPEVGQPQLALTQDILNGSFGRFLGYLQSKGAKTLEWGTLQIVALGENKALASGMAIIKNSSGEEIDRRTSIYSLYKSADGWRISMIQSHPADQMPVLTKGS